MLLISSHTVDQMVKNARVAAWFMDYVVGEGIFFQNDFQLDHLFLKSKHESMSKVVPAELQKFLQISALKSNASGGRALHCSPTAMRNR